VLFPFAEKLKRVLFLGTFIDGQVEVQQQTFRVFLNVYDPFFTRSVTLSSNGSIGV
jgi:hypothetical protein